MSMSLRSKSKVDSTPRLTRSQAAAALASSSNANTPPPTSAPRSQRSKVIDEENSKPASKATSKDTGKKGKGKGKVAVKEEDPVVAGSAETAPTKPANATRSRVKAQPKAKARTSARRKSTKKEGDKVEGPASEEVGEGGEKDEKMDEDNEDSGDLSEEVYCICKGKDDGSPMIKCEGDCQNWYHFGCISMNEDDADRVALYICPECEARTGKKTQWEDNTSKRTDEPDNETGNEAKDVQMDSPEPAQKKELKEEEDESEGEGEGSGDDYVAETERIGTSRKRSLSMRKKSISSHKALSSSETSDSDDNSRPRRLIRGQPRPKRLKRATSKSPAPETHISIKRRASTAATLQQTESKRSKTEDDANERGGKDDPVRKYCLGKLEEVIVPIFLEALVKRKEAEKGKEEKSERIEDGGGGGGDTHAPTESSTAVGVEAAESGASPAEQESSQQKSVEKEEEIFVSDEEKKEAEAKASTFVAALERCMFDTYAEPDKTGRLVASGKYKERFRTLHFNLGKSDRVLLRRDIAAERIQPSQLNTMSSTDLADEKTKQEIEIFEKEALEHSTLTTITAPRAKITHKGFEDIEDVTGMGQRNQDALREEEERMERERRERARLASTRTRAPSQGSPTTGREHASMSPGLPLSPITPTSATPWGAPPPLPLHAIHVDDAVGVGSGLGAGMIIGGRLHPRPLFVPSASDFGSSMEGGLNLADLINIDDDPSTDEVVEKSQTSNQPRAETESTASVTPEVITPSGPSPFVVNLPMESPRRASFDLNSLWSAQSKEADKTEAVAEKPKEDAPKEDKQEPASVSRVGDAERSDSMELDSTEEQETKDQDFDMFLKEDGGGNGEAKIAGPSTPVKEDIDVESLTQVWVGAISMPRDNNAPLAPGVSARQVGGRTLDLNSGLWNALFPSTAARIDGRVPVDKSSPYLVSMRLNSAKELVAVCFVPTSDNERQKYDELISFLLGKGRHALCFPWGEHPKPNAPGRELYIIPLLHDQPIPEYIELLDDLRLPKTRKSNLLIGVFVLNKGKLVAPPPSRTAAPPPVQLTPPLASLPFALPASAPPASTAGVPPILPTALAGVNPAALAAEVASLTPEQISLMLRQLTQAQGPPPPPPNSASPPNHVPPPHTYPGMPPLPGNFGSSPPPPPPNGGYPSYGQPPPPHPPYQRQLSPPGHGRRESYDDYDNYDDGYSGRPYGRDDRGRGGRGRGYDRDHRGRGRGGNRGRGRPYDRDQGRYHDSGWSARARSPPDYTRGARFD